MRKVASIFSILIGFVVLAASTSKTIMGRITNLREGAPKGAWWAARKADKGDLVRMSYLDDVPEFRDENVHHFIKAATGKRNIDLYIYGDSYTAAVPDSAFYGLHAYRFGTHYEDFSYNLNAARTNILIIEFGERFIRENFDRAENIFEHLYHRRQHEPEKPGRLSAYLDDIFNPHVNQNIEYNIFSYDFITPIPSFKAKMNAALFHRGSGDVVISDDGNWLFLKSTVVPRGKASSIEPVTKDQFDNLITQINRTYDHYKREGFTEVYLTIPPNPVSLVQPAEYNQLLSEIQKSRKNGQLNMPVIDVYETIKQTGNPAAYYLHGDTHWNDKGLQLWIWKMNQMLQSWKRDTATHKMHW